RYAGTGIRCNGELTGAALRRLARVTPSAMRLLYEAHDREGLSARGHHRVLRVARTIADLAGSAEVGPEHVRAAVVLRMDATEQAAAA
ncbi:MAG TPA: hypothetical protein VM266_05025, partial [Solirubrobacteraceae bacterium]|nr:hypothetical protein [Solirubrobacteraceae bacterium]